MGDSVELPGSARFIVKRCLGSGGFGTVYEALDQKRNALVALKVLRPERSTALYGFKREFRALAGITHHNLVTLYELLSDGERWSFSMELVHGTDFLTHVRSPGPAEKLPKYLATQTHSDDGPEDTATHEADRAVPRPDRAPCSLERLLPALLQLTEGVLALHRQGMIHRDLKPANVLCTPEGRVVVLDFGLAQEISAQAGVEGAVQTLAGTPDYMSPEQAQRRPLTAASDWYSVGALLYEALTGRLPFSGSPHQILQQKIAQTPISPSRVRSDLPPALDAFCMRLLSRDEARRPSGQEVLSEVRALNAQPEVVSASLPNEEPYFIGRERQLAALADAFAATRNGQTVAALCHGGSGAGKSTLCKRFLSSLVEKDDKTLVLAGRCYEHEAVPFKALDGLIDSLSRVLRHGSREEIEELLPRDVSFLSRLFPVLLQVPAIKEAPQRRIADDLQVQKAAYSALRELLISLCQTRPLVLYIDDLQWGDEDGISLLLEVVRPPQPPPLLLLVSYRSDEAASSAALQRLSRGLRSELERCVAIHEIPVSELSSGESEALALALLSDSADDVARQRAATIAKEAHGNAFFITELSRGLSDDLPLPIDGSSLDTMIRSRVARLPAAPQKLLTAIAVAGQPVSRVATALAAYGDAQETDEPLALALLRSHRLVRVRHARSERQGEKDGELREELLPYHDRVREAVVAGLLPEELSAQHLRLARALLASGPAEPEQLVLHLHRGGDLAGAAHYAVQASASSEKALAYHQVVRLCHAALDTGKLTAQETYVIKARLADALAGTGRPKEAGEAYLALVAHETPERALQRRRQAGKQFFAGGYVQEGRQVLGELLSAANLGLPRRVFFLHWSMRAYRLLLALRGLRYEERREADISAQELLRLDACEAVASITAIDPVLGHNFRAKTLYYALRAGEPRRIARALAGEALTLAAAEAKDTRVGSTLTQAQAMAERLGDSYSRGHAIYVTGHIAHLQGRWKESSQCLRRAAEILKDECVEATSQIDFVGTLQLYNLRFMGALHELSEALPPLLKDATERGRQSQAVIVQLIAGFLLPLREDDPARAVDLVQTASQLIRSQAFNLQHLFALEANLMILLYQGCGREAWQALRAQTAAIARSRQLRLGFFQRVWHYLVALVSLAANQPMQLAQDAAQGLSRGKALFCAPMATLVRALLFRRQKRPREALALMEEAERLFAECDMSMHAAAARLRRGTWRGGDEGGQLVADASSAMRRQGIRRPHRFAAMLAPECDSR